MYHIYKNEYKKFGLQKRDKILEKFYLFKCYSYLSKQEYEQYTLLFNRFNVALEVKYYLFYEDDDFKKFDKLMKHLTKYSHIYKINDDDIIYIKAFFTFVIKDNRGLANTIIQPLVTKGSLQAIYLLALQLNEKEPTNQFFSLLEKYNYYKSFCDYSVFLFKEMNNVTKALEVLKKAIEHGEPRAYYLYYDMFLSTVDFTKIKDNEDFQKDLSFLFNILIDNICLDEAFCYFEFFYLRKICIKHFNLRDWLEKEYLEYMKDFVNILLHNSVPSLSKTDIEQKKQLAKDLYIRKDYFSEFNLSCGIIYYYGIENLIKPDLKTSLIKFKVAFDNSDSKSYKRFCYSYIPKIYKKLINQNDKEITEEEDQNSKSTLFQLYYSSMDVNTISHLSSSFFYFLYKLYAMKWGNQGDDLMEYICLLKASGNIKNQPGTGTIISYYRKYKANNHMNIIKNEEKVIGKLKNLSLNYDSEGYGDDGSICPICIVNKRDIILYPCKHRFCKTCTDKIMEKKQCPICRSYILINFDSTNLTTNI